MKKVFLSQPMSGLTEEDVFTVRHKAEAYLAEKVFGDNEFEIIDTYHRDKEAPSNATRIWFLGRSIMDLYNVDQVVFVRGWEKGPGCKVERYVCDTYNIPYIDIPVSLED